MNRFIILDIRPPWALTGRSRRRTGADRPAEALDVCRLSGGVLPTDCPASPCGSLPQPY